MWACVRPLLCCTVCARFAGMVSVKTHLLGKTQLTVIRSRTQSQCFCPQPSAAAQSKESHFPERFTELFLESVKLEVCVSVFSHLSVAMIRRDIFPSTLCCRGISSPCHFVASFWKAGVSKWPARSFVCVSCVVVCLCNHYILSKFRYPAFGKSST